MSTPLYDNRANASNAPLQPPLQYTANTTPVANSLPGSAKHTPGSQPMVIPADNVYSHYHNPQATPSRISSAPQNRNHYDSYGVQPILPEYKVQPVYAPPPTQPYQKSHSSRPPYPPPHHQQQQQQQQQQSQQQPQPQSQSQQHQPQLQQPHQQQPQLQQQQPQQQHHPLQQHHHPQQPATSVTHSNHRVPSLPSMVGLDLSGAQEIPNGLQTPASSLYYYSSGTTTPTAIHDNGSTPGYGYTNGSHYATPVSRPTPRTYYMDTPPQTTPSIPAGDYGIYNSVGDIYNNAQPQIQPMAQPLLQPQRPPPASRQPSTFQNVYSHSNQPLPPPSNPHYGQTQTPFDYQTRPKSTGPVPEDPHNVAESYRSKRH
ncbi:hypothetical protein J3Q64DRAFT_1458057 [Phycomyces blakesleeanus]|uniref:Uncharacterized protein n=1 Tax=Phycomyces blakesleeanus TaxID=4837 RepID=A0ABR3B1T1_PHYBL